MYGFLPTEALASNLRANAGEPYTREQFLEIYPQFAETVSPGYLQMTLDRANQVITTGRYRAYRDQAIGLYCAHYCVEYLKGMPEDLSSADQAVRKGESRGTLTSKSVGGVSVSYGAAEGSNDLAGFGSMRDTIYGQQLITIAKLVSHGMMVVR